MTFIEGTCARKKENITNNKFLWLVKFLKARNNDDVIYMKLTTVGDERHLHLWLTCVAHSLVLRLRRSLSLWLSKQDYS